MEPLALARDGDVAAEAFREGFYADALRAASHIPLLERAQIALRVGLRQRRFDDVRNAALIIAEQTLDADDRAVAVAYVALAQVALGELSDADIPAIATSRKARAEIAYVRARIAFMADRREDIHAELAVVAPVTKEQVAHYINMRAWAHVHTDPHKHGVLLINALGQALDAFDTQNVDIGLIAHLAHPLAVLTMEMDLGDVHNRAVELLERIRWSGEPSEARFYTERALAWSCGLAGEYPKALLRLDRALAIAPDAARRAVANIDRARIAAEVGERTNATIAIERAFEEFEAVDWACHADDAVLGVFAAMDVLTYAQAPRAETLFRIVEKAWREHPNFALALARVPRAEAFHLFGRSFLVASDAEADVVKAYKIYKHYKFRYRAALCALRAHDLTNDGRWLDRAQRFAIVFPRSSVAMEVTRRLGPVQGRLREVLERACEGLSNKQIATELAISPATVKNHVQKLHKLLDVKSRAEMIVRTRAIGLLAS